ncbi:hypothetical protein CsSME_00037820 [Camellia sinensis var. sinensis]
MEDSQESVNRNGFHNIMMTIHSSSHQVYLSWLNLKVFYVGITKCEVDNSTPQWSMNCESEMDAGTRFLKGKPDTGQESDSPRTEVSDYPNYKPENEDYDNLYTGTENLGGENGERSRFNAGGRVGVGIGLSICVGIGIGVSLLPRTYQGTCQKLQKAAIIAYTILVGLSSPTSYIYALA